MPLPTISVPKYELKLPSNGQKVKYRPYLVKEEKILMIALESQDQMQILAAVKETIAACANGAIDPDKLAVFDLEYMFLKLRAKSVGEISNLNLKCVKCDKLSKVSINLEEIQVDVSALPKNTIKLTDKIGVVMTWPKVALVSELVKADPSANEKQSLAFDMILGCIESVYDEKGVYLAADQTKDELNTFIESLNQNQFAKIQNFIEATPKLQHQVNFACEHCKENNELLLKGLQNFF